MGKYTKEEKLWAVTQLLEGKGSLRSISKQLGADRKSIGEWRTQYQTFGAAAFDHTRNLHYSEQTKREAVEYYLSGKGSLLETCKHFKIRANYQLRSWISLYNSHELKETPGTSGGNRVMAKGRKTSFEERVQIVEECIKNGKNYGKAAEKFSVSYTQVYNWVRKYDKQGADGLIDRRGRSKPKSEMTDMEKLEAENRLLKAQLERKELENMFLKKLDEIERRRF